MRSSILKLAGLTAFLFCLAPGISQAATCTVNVANDPDPFITGASGTTTCGLGTSENDSAGVIDDVTGITGTFTLLDKDENTGNLDSQLFFTGTSEGEWGIDLNGNTYDALVLVIKDGGTGSGGTGPDEIQWVWFEIDLAGDCDAATTAITTPYSQADLCGTWAMWGNENSPSTTDRKAISHMTLYGIVDGGGTGQENPEPATLLLLGLGLAGMALTQRRRRRI